MAALDFPTSPNVNDIYDSGTQRWQWDGTTWNEITNERIGTFTANSMNINSGKKLNIQKFNADYMWGVRVGETSTDGISIGEISDPTLPSIEIKNYAGTADPYYSFLFDNFNVSIPSSRVVIGRNCTSLQTEIRANESVIIGHEAGFSNRSSPRNAGNYTSQCVYIGYNAAAMKYHNVSASGPTGIAQRNTIIGSQAQGLQTSGSWNSYNTAIGYKALYNHRGTSTSEYVTQNVCVGSDSGQKLGQGSLVQRSTCIGYLSGSGAQLTSLNNATYIGYNATSGSTNEIVLGDSNITTLRCNVQSISALSDARDKKNIQDLSIGLNYIKDLNPVEFDWDRRKGNGDITGHDCGFTAQELQQSEEKFDVKWLNTVIEDKEDDKLLASYERLLPVMVKAIQELISEIKQLEESYSV